MDASLQAEPHGLRSRRPTTFILILLIGTAAILASLFVRNSAWARERRLKSLSLEELALAIHDSPDDSLTFLYYGSALMKAGNLDASEKAFGRAVSLDPKLVRARLGLGSALLREGRFRTAEAEFARAASLSPNDPAAYLGMAQAYSGGGTSKLAIEPLKKLTQLTPRDSMSWYSLGMMYGNLQQWDSAYVAMQRASSLAPSEPEFWRELAQISTHYNRLADAEKQYQKALSLSPKDSLCYRLLGQLYMRMGDTPALRANAEKALLMAIALDPNMATAYLALGRLYEQSGDYRPALEKLERASQLDRTDDQSLYHQGLCEIKLGKASQGRKLIQASQELARVKSEISSLENRCAAEPSNLELRLRLALIYRKYDNLDGAMRILQDMQRKGAQEPRVASEIASLTAEIKREQQPSSSSGGPMQAASGSSR